MVGKIVRCLTQYYDARLQRISIKSRPALVLKSPENDDYVVLPISTIPNRINVNPTYDIEIDPAKIGLAGSPTKVNKSFTKGVKEPGVLHEVDPKEAANIILEKLKEKFII